MYWKKIEFLKLLTSSLCITFVIVLWVSSHRTGAFAPTVVIEKPLVQTKELIPAFSTLINLQYSEPYVIKIPSLQVNTSIEEVGILEDGSMGTPNNFNNVAWLKTSSKVGQDGNLVISGHYDRVGGTPAVFYNLSNLEKNDKVIIGYKSKSGAELQKEYVITEKFLADPESKEHINEAYEQTENPTITLITCNGVWNPIKGEYSHRIVVQGNLINTTTAKSNVDREEREYYSQPRF